MSRLNCSSESDEDEFYGPITAREIELDWRRLMAEKNKKREEAVVSPEQSKPVAGEEEKTISIDEKLDPLPKLIANDNSIGFIDEDDSITMDVDVEAETFSKAPLQVSEFNNGLETVEHMDHCEGMDEIEMPMRGETADKSLISVKGDNHYEVYIPFSPPSKKLFHNFTHGMDGKNFQDNTLPDKSMISVKGDNRYEVYIPQTPLDNTVDILNGLPENSFVNEINGHEISEADNSVVYLNIIGDTNINDQSQMNHKQQIQNTNLNMSSIEESEINISNRSHGVQEKIMDSSTSRANESISQETLIGNILEESKKNCSTAINITTDFHNDSKICLTGNILKELNITTNALDDSKINCLTTIDLTGNVLEELNITTNALEESKRNSSTAFDLTTNIVDELKINCSSTGDLTTDMHDKSKNALTCKLLEESKINSSTVVDLTIDLVDELKIHCSTIDLTTDMHDNSMIDLTDNKLEESKENCSAAVDITINALDKAKINSSTVVDRTTEIVDELKINCLSAVDTTDMHDESKINSSIVLDIPTKIVDESKINCTSAVDNIEENCVKSISEDTSTVIVSSNNVGFIESEELNKTNPVSESLMSEQDNDSVLDASLNLSKSTSFSLNCSKYMHLLSSDAESSFISTNEDVIVDTLPKPVENANILDFEISSKEKEESFRIKDISLHKTEEVIQKLEKTMLTDETPLAQPAIEMYGSTSELSICSNKSMDCNSAEEKVSIVTDHIMVNAAEEITREDVNSFINSDSGDSSGKSFSSLPNEEIISENKQTDGISYSPPGKKQCFTNKENDDPKSRIPIPSAHKLPVVKPAILTVDNIVKSTPWASDFKRKKIPQPKKPSYIVSPNKLDRLLKTTPANKPIRPRTADSSINKTPLMPLQQNSRVFSTPNVMSALKLKSPTPLKQIPVLFKNNAGTPVQLKTPPKNPKYKDIASPVAEYIKNPTTVIRNVTPTRKCAEIASENIQDKTKTTPKPDFCLTAKYYSSADRCFVKPSAIKSPVLPKMGERQAAILVTPKPQVLKHLGRVKSDEKSGQDRLGIMKPGRRTSLNNTSFANLPPSSMDLDISVIQKQ